MFFFSLFLICEEADPVALVLQAMQLLFLAVLENNIHIVPVAVTHGMHLEGRLICFLLVGEGDDDGSALLQSNQIVILQMAAIEDGQPLGILFPVELHAVPPSFVGILHNASPACVVANQLVLGLPFVLLRIEVPVLVPDRAQQGGTVVIAPVAEDSHRIPIHELFIQVCHTYSRPFHKIRVFANIIIPYIYITIKFSTSNHLL